MWMMTTRGFFSAVAKDSADLTKITVRGRRKKHLESLRELIPDSSEPYTGAGTDYPWRIDCTAAQWAEACALMALEVNYKNFKDEVKARGQSLEAAAYGSVWSALLKIEDRDGPDKGTTSWSNWQGYGRLYDVWENMGVSGEILRNGGKFDRMQQDSRTPVDWNVCGDWRFGSTRWKLRTGMKPAQRQRQVDLLLNAVALWEARDPKFEVALEKVRKGTRRKSRKAGERTRPGSGSTQHGLPPDPMSMDEALALLETGESGNG